MKEENETKVKEPTNEKELDIKITSKIQVREIKNKTEVREVIHRKEQKKTTTGTKQKEWKTEREEFTVQKKINVSIPKNCYNLIRQECQTTFK
jgi:hypothetical protein